jgi:hypothetical protein
MKFVTPRAPNLRIREHVYDYRPDAKERIVIEPSADFMQELVASGSFWIFIPEWEFTKVCIDWSKEKIRGSCKQHYPDSRGFVGDVRWLLFEEAETLLIKLPKESP